MTVDVSAFPLYLIVIFFSLLDACAMCVWDMRKYDNYNTYNTAEPKRGIWLEKMWEDSQILVGTERLYYLLDDFVYDSNNIHKVSHLQSQLSLSVPSQCRRLALHSTSNVHASSIGAMTMGEWHVCLRASESFYIILLFRFYFSTTTWPKNHQGDAESSIIIYVHCNEMVIKNTTPGEKASMKHE